MTYEHQVGVNCEFNREGRCVFCGITKVEFDRIRIEQTVEAEIEEAR